MSVEDHETCKCQCKVGPQDCDPKRQYHHESTCQCKCRDEFTESRMNCTKPFMVSTMMSFNEMYLKGNSNAMLYFHFVV